MAGPERPPLGPPCRRDGIRGWIAAHLRRRCRRDLPRHAHRKSLGARAPRRCPRSVGSRGGCSRVACLAPALFARRRARRRPTTTAAIAWRAYRPAADTLLRVAAGSRRGGRLARLARRAKAGTWCRAARRHRRFGWAVESTVPGDTGLPNLSMHSLRQSGIAARYFVGRRSSRGTWRRRDTGEPRDSTACPRACGGYRARPAGAACRRRPAGVENDPLPNAFVFVREGSPAVQRDSVWDVAAAPDWQRVAYSRAYTTRPGESDSVPPSEWRRLAGRVGLKESLVRQKRVFDERHGVGVWSRPYLRGRSEPCGRYTAAPRPLPDRRGDGGRVDAGRFTPRVGAPPEVIADDARRRAGVSSTR